MSEGTLIKPRCFPQLAWDKSGPVARVCLLMLVRRLEELKRPPGMNSGNSSLPPSSDRPRQQAASTAKPKSRRKRGRQAGHVKRTRSLIPTEACNRVVRHRPAACSDCGRNSAATPRSPNAIRQRKSPPLSRLSRNTRFVPCSVRTAGIAVEDSCQRQTCTQTDPAELTVRCTVTTAENRTDRALKSSHHLWNL